MEASSNLTLIVLSGPAAGSSYALEGAMGHIVMGSDPSANIQFEGAAVAPSHAMVVIDETGIAVQPAAPGVVLFLNDDPIDAPTVLNNGDVLWMGSPGDEGAVMIQCQIGPAEAGTFEDDASGLGAEPAEAPVAPELEDSPFDAEGAVVEPLPEPEAEPAIFATEGDAPPDAVEAAFIADDSDWEAASADPGWSAAEPVVPPSESVFEAEPEFEAEAESEPESPAPSADEAWEVDSAADSSSSWSDDDQPVEVESAEATEDDAAFFAPEPVGEAQPEPSAFAEQSEPEAEAQAEPALWAEPEAEGLEETESDQPASAPEDSAEADDDEPPTVAYAPGESPEVEREEAFWGGEQEPAGEPEAVEGAAEESFVHEPEFEPGDEPETVALTSDEAPTLADPDFVAGEEFASAADETPGAADGVAESPFVAETQEYESPFVQEGAPPPAFDDAPTIESEAVEAEEPAFIEDAPVTETLEVQGAPEPPPPLPGDDVKTAIGTRRPAPPPRPAAGAPPSPAPPSPPKASAPPPPRPAAARPRADGSGPPRRPADRSLPPRRPDASLPPRRRPAPAAPAARPRAGAARPVGRPARPARGGPAPAVIFGGVVLLAAVAGGVGYLMLRGGAQPPTPPPVSVAQTLTPPTTLSAAGLPTPEPGLDPGVADPLDPGLGVEPTPELTATPAPTPEPTAVPVATTPTPARATPTPTPVPTATPPPAPTGPSPEQQRAQQVAALLQQAQAAASNPQEASRLFGQVLQLDPGNAQAQAGKAAADAAQAALQKSFAPGRTAYASPNKGGGPAGFDTAGVADPDYLGELQYEVSPPRVKPGDAFTVRVFLANKGKKEIKPGQVSITTSANRRREQGGGASATATIAAGQRGVVHEQSGSWAAGTTEWYMDVLVTSQRGDTYGSRLTWR